MNFPLTIEKQKLYELAEWLVGGLVLLYGMRHIREIVAFVLMELYKLLVQRNIMIA